MTDQDFLPLARRILRKTAWLAVLGAILIALIQGLGQYTAKQREQGKALDEFALSYANLLAIAVWDIEPETIRRLLKTIAERPDVALVRLKTHTGQAFEHSRSTSAPTGLPRSVPIPYPTAAKGSIGTLEIYPDNAHLSELSLEHAIQAFLSHLALLALMFGLLHLILQRELQYPLERIAHFVRRLTPDELGTPLDLDRPNHRGRDELDLVSDGFRTLQTSISHHIDTLDTQVAERTRQLEEALAEVRALSLTDALTGCYNRRYLEEWLPPEIVRAARYDRPMSVVFMDVDHFKPINDEHGHATGDAVLSTVGMRLRTELREQLDWSARYGGEEFVIVLPETTLEEAILFAERLRHRIELCCTQYQGREICVTASFGVTQCQADDDAPALLARADALLYRAKEEGRNRVCAG